MIMKFNRLVLSIEIGVTSDGRSMRHVQFVVHLRAVVNLDRPSKTY